MLTVDALYALYVALGGDVTDIKTKTTIPECINEIATLIAGGALKELPKVTSSDNGKLLTVVSGKWAKADAPVELPAVTGDDDGKVLTVADGAWSAQSLPANNNENVGG